MLPNAPTREVLAMTMTLVEETYGTMKKIKASWVEASAVATATTVNTYNGKIQALTTIPNGSSAPAASYDVTVKDESSVDVLIDAGLSRAAAAIENVKAGSMGAVANDKLTIADANAGSSSGAGDIYLFIR